MAGGSAVAATVPGAGTAEVRGGMTAVLAGAAPARARAAGRTVLSANLFSSTPARSVRFAPFRSIVSRELTARVVDAAASVATETQYSSS